MSVKVSRLLVETNDDKITPIKSKTAWKET